MPVLSPPKITHGKVARLEAGAINKNVNRTHGKIGHNSFLADFSDAFERGVDRVSVSEVKNHIIDFVDGLPDMSRTDKQSLITEIGDLSDKSITILYENLKTNLKRSVRMEWDARLKDYIDSKPPTYAQYKKSGGLKNPLEFLEETWGQFLDHEVLYQDKLTSYDSTLINNIYAYWQKHGRSPDDRLPLAKKSRTDVILEEASAGPYSLKEIIRSARTAQRRSSRRSDPADEETSPGGPGRE